MFRSNEYKYERNLAVHTWNSNAYAEHLKGFSMMWTTQCKSTLLTMLQAYVPTPLFTITITCGGRKEKLIEPIRSVVDQAVSGKWVEI